MLISAHAAYMGCNIPVPVAGISTHTALRAVTRAGAAEMDKRDHFYSHGSASRDNGDGSAEWGTVDFYSHGSASRDPRLRVHDVLELHFYSHGSASRDL